MFGKGRDTGDAGIFVVEVVLDELLFGGPDGWEDIRLAFVVACRMSEVSLKMRVIQSNETWCYSRYAPTPKLIFSLKLSFLKASVIPRMASGGPSLTLAHVDALTLAMRRTCC